jgi:hypothetical protein
VRGTTRDPSRVALIEDAGGEGVVADPDRVVTLAPALAGVGVVCVLLGSAQGSAGAVEALHSERLAMLLSRIIDTPVRGFIYEASGSVDPTVLGRGAELVTEFCSRSHIPLGLVADRGVAPWDLWAARLADDVERVLTPP